MNNYDFLNLSPGEFELLVRDLLQAERSIFIENFPEGSDGGMDLRYSTEAGEVVIIQCKRYRSFPSLLKNLEKEIIKVSILNPSKYIIATSVSLTPARKNKIRRLFSKYIISDADIIGRENLNNLLGLHPKILLTHYKLYISGTSVLQKIINSKVYNESRFEEDEITEVVKVYVQNDSFKEALEILQQHHVVLISGHPGVGKTTLARMLVYYLLSSGFDEFAFLSDSVSEGVGSHEQGKKIVYFFDDFLGTNFLDNKMPANEDGRLMRFISSIKRSKEHALLLTTREYILNQAQQSFEKLNDPDLQISKCILDLGKYTHVIKAQILANHLYFNEIPISYLEQLMKDDMYFEIIYHENFNPRIIEMIVDKGEWKNHSPDSFPSLLLQAFDNPEVIWLRIYENQISMFSRCALAILATFNSTIYLDDFEKAIQKFADEKQKSYGFSFNNFDFKKSLKEMQNTFITTSIDDSGDIGLSFQNPSIRDFLINYLSSPLNSQLLKDIIQSAVSIDQLTTNIEKDIPRIKNNLPFTVGIKIQISKDFTDIIKELIVTKYESLESFRLSQYNSNGNAGFKRYYVVQDEFSKLAMLLNETLYTSKADAYHLFIVSKMQTLLSFAYLDFDERQAFIKLFEKLHTFLSFDENDIAYNFGKSLTYLNDWTAFITLKKIIPNGVASFKSDLKLFTERYAISISNEKRKENADYLEYSIKELTKIGEEFEFNVKPEIKSFQMMNNEGDLLGDTTLTGIHIPDFTNPEYTETNTEKNQIKRLFEGMIQNTD
jgi:DNA polymerase III delta prime subunit